MLQFLPVCFRKCSLAYATVHPSLGASERICVCRAKGPGAHHDVEETPRAFSHRVSTNMRKNAGCRGLSKTRWNVLVQCLQPPYQIHVVCRTECPPFFWAQCLNHVGYPGTVPATSPPTLCGLQDGLLAVFLQRPGKSW